MEFAQVLKTLRDYRRNVTAESNLLTQALAQKKAELALFCHDLTTPEFKDDPWRIKAIVTIEEQVKEIERYMKEGGKLNIGECCQKEGTCVLAFKRFDGCAWGHTESGFYFNEPKA